MERKQIAASCVGLVNSICLIMQESYVALGDSCRERERERKTEKRKDFRTVKVSSRTSLQSSWTLTPVIDLFVLFYFFITIFFYVQLIILEPVQCERILHCTNARVSKQWHIWHNVHQARRNEVEVKLIPIIICHDFCYHLKLAYKEVFLYHLKWKVQ